MKKKFLLLSSLIMVIGCAGMGNTAQAQDGNGGQVQTNGQISFYEDEPIASTSSSEPVSSSSSTTPSSSYPDTLVTTTSSEAVVTKPAGKYPSTGELVKKSLSISGAALVAIAFLLFLYKRRKKEAEE